MLGEFLVCIWDCVGYIEDCWRLLGEFLVCIWGCWVIIRSCWRLLGEFLVCIWGCVGGFEDGKSNCVVFIFFFNLKKKQKEIN